MWVFLTQGLLFCADGCSLPEMVDSCICPVLYLFLEECLPQYQLFYCSWKQVFFLSVSFLSKNILLANNFRCRSLAGPEMTGLSNINLKVTLMI